MHQLFVEQKLISCRFGGKFSELFTGVPVLYGEGFLFGALPLWRASGVFCPGFEISEAFNARKVTQFKTVEPCFPRSFLRFEGVLEGRNASNT